MSSNAPSRGERILAWLVVILAVGFVVLGAFWYGFSAEVHERIWKDIVARPGGPMTFRFILQPTMAAIVASRDGIKDARLGRPPFFWTVLHSPQQRGRRLREELISTARIVLLGLGMDAIYQHQVLKTFYPAEAVLIAFLLAVVPYFLIRGPVSRIARRRIARSRRAASGTRQ